MSAKTREKVLKTAERFQLKIGVFLPTEISSFFDALRAGIQAAQTDADAPIDLSFFSYPRPGDGDVGAMEKAHWQRFDGMIVAPGNSAAWKRITDLAKQQGRPIVFVGTDAPRLHRIASVAVDAE